MIETRRQQLADCDAIVGIGMEIGAYARPTVSPDQAGMKFLDFFSTDELQAQALKNGSEDVGAIVNVDYVVRGEDYREYVPDTFDFIIANHVMEHIVDPISWLNMLGDLLKPGGHLLITLPDKKYSFDRFRPDTDLSRLVYNYVSDASLEEKAKVHSLEAAMYYDFGYVKMPMEVEIMLDIERLKGGMNAHQPGIHCHVFQGETFLSKILKPLIYMKAINFSLRKYVPSSPYGEFYFVLKKGWEPVELETDEFYTLEHAVASADI